MLNERNSAWNPFDIELPFESVRAFLFCFFVSPSFAISPERESVLTETSRVPVSRDIISFALFFQPRAHFPASSLFVPIISDHLSAILLDLFVDRFLAIFYWFGRPK